MNTEHTVETSDKMNTSQSADAQPVLSAEDTVVMGEIQEESEKDDLETSKLPAALSYIIPVLPYLLMARKSAFAKWHANQGVWWFLTCIVFFGALQAFWAVMSFLPFVGGVISALLVMAHIVCRAVVIIVAGIGFVNAFQGRKQPLPYIGVFFEERSMLKNIK